MNVFYIFPLIFLCLLSCTSRNELTVAVGGTSAEVNYWYRIIKEFEKKEGIKVRIIRQASDSDLRRQHLILSMISRLKDPDVFFMDIAWLGQFIHSGWLEPLDIDTKPFFKGSIEVAHKNGRLYALPVNIDCGLLYYRSDLLEKYGCGVPETWEELLECSLKAVDEGVYGFVWQGAQYEGLVCTFLEFSYSAAGGFENINSEENLKALIFMRDIIRRYKISPPDTYVSMKEEEVRIIFQRGLALFERNWPYASKLHSAGNSPVKGKFGIAPLPRFEDGRRASCLGGWYIGLSRFSDRKEEGKKLIRFITSYRVQKDLVEGLGWNSPRIDVMEELGEKYNHLKVVKEACTYAVARPPVPYYAQISYIIQKYVNGVLAGLIEPEEALSKMEKEIREIKEYYK